MARRPRIDLDEPSSELGGTPDPNAGDSGSGGSDSGDGAGNGGSGGGSADPASILGTTSGGGGSNDDDYIRDDSGAILYDVRGRARKRRRGRGTSKRAKAAGKKVPVDALAQLLVLAHGTLAVLTKTPELEITDNEAKMLANPLSEILVLYDIAPPPEMLVAMQIMYASSYVYGPRIVMIRARLKEEAEKRRAEAAKNVTPAPHSEQPFEQAVAAMEVLDVSGLDIQTNYGGLKN